MVYCLHRTIWKFLEIQFIRALLDDHLNYQVLAEFSDLPLPLLPLKKKNNNTALYFAEGETDVFWHIVSRLNL